MSRRRPLQHAAPLALAALVASCAGAASGTQQVSTRDAETFASNVQPYLEASCATLDCHGAPGRALRLYSELGLRASSALRSKPIAAKHDPVALTAAELDENRLAFASVALASDKPEAQLALLKPLALGQGGIHHVGGVHWASKDDPGYLCLRGWLVGDIKQDLASECAMALDAAQRK